MLGSSRSDGGCGVSRYILHVNIHKVHVHVHLNLWRSRCRDRVSFGVSITSVRITKIQQSFAGSSLYDIGGYINDTCDPNLI